MGILKKYSRLTKRNSNLNGGRKQLAELGDLIKRLRNQRSLKHVFQKLRKYRRHLASANDIARELVALQARHDGPLYHAPSDLEVTSASLRRVLIVGSCQAGEWAFDRSNPSDCPCDVVLINNLGSLPDLPSNDCGEYDFQIVQLPLLFILEDVSLWGLKYEDIDSHRMAFDTACAKLELQLEMAMKWNRQNRILTFVTNFMVPQQNPMGRLFPRYDIRNPGFLIEEINRRLAELLKTYDNCYMLDIDMLSAIYGKRFMQDDHLLWISHGSIIESYGSDFSRIQPSPPLEEYYELRRDEFIESIWREAVAMYSAIQQWDAVKLVVLDLDDTLWKGIQVENESVGREMLAGWPMGMVEALVYLKKRGVQLAIISKNAERQVREDWSAIFGGLLSLDDFAGVKLNSLPKAENMTEILTSISVPPESVVFIDDDPEEREAMKVAFPKIRQLPPGHYYWKRILLWAPETQGEGSEGAVTQKKTIQPPIKRDTRRAGLSRIEFLISLNLHVNLFPVRSVGDPRFSRAIELLNKTSQFNTTGKQWRREECIAFFEEDSLFYVFDAEDRHSAYGLVGVVVASENVVTQFVMSCRVVGLDIELAVMKKISSVLRKRGHTEIRGVFTMTDKNLVCQDLWTKAGFKGGPDLWSLDLRHSGVNDKSETQADHVKVMMK